MPPPPPGQFHTAQVPPPVMKRPPYQLERPVMNGTNVASVTVDKDAGTRYTNESSESGAGNHSKPDKG
jgi:hypothetical protein